MNTDGNVDDKAGLERETTTRFKHSTPQNPLYFWSGEGGLSKVENPGTFGSWHKDLSCMGRSRSCLSSKGPWAANANLPQLWSELFAQAQRERRTIQAGQMVGRKQLPTAAGSSKNPGKSSKKSREEQPKHSHIQLRDRESREQEDGQEKGGGNQHSFHHLAKDNELRNHLGGFSDPFSPYPSENQ